MVVVVVGGGGVVVVVVVVVVLVVVVVVVKTLSDSTINHTMRPAHHGIAWAWIFSVAGS